LYDKKYIKAPAQGLIQNRPDIILPDDAFPVLENAYVFREKLVRKSGAAALGRFARTFTAQNFFKTTASPWTFNMLVVTGYVSAANNANPGQITTTFPHGLTNGDKVIITGIVGATGYNNVTFTITVVNTTAFTVGVDATTFGAYASGGFWISNRSLTTATTSPLETYAELPRGFFSITFPGPVTLTDNGNGVLTSSTVGYSGTINYVTGAISITHPLGAGIATTVTYTYNPALPVMGLLPQETTAINYRNTLGFDQKYCYTYGANGWQEYLPGTVWSGSNSDFFFPMNYWTSGTNKLFWVTNYNTNPGDPIRYTDTTAWYSFSPEINTSGPTYLWQCLAMTPFRGYTIAFNTWEGTSFPGVNYPQRIRWSVVGNPIPSGMYQPWLDDNRQGAGFLDIPTSQSITCIGFVRDNLVIYCETSTWQLRWTGLKIAPFQLEKVNTELGADSTFSAIQFDTSLVGIGDRGIIECDSFQSKRIDIKIVDLVYQFSGINSGPQRVYGARDFVNKLAYWMFTFGPTGAIFPDRRLVYNYENDSWAIFKDSYTALGLYQSTTQIVWQNSSFSWNQANANWIGNPSYQPLVVGGNPQGFVMVLDQLNTNQISMSITNITVGADLKVLIQCINHNLESGDFIEIIAISTSAPELATLLNGKNYKVVVPPGFPANTFYIQYYDAVAQDFDYVTLSGSFTVYQGGGKITVRDNFNITSRKFHYLEDGQAIQLGFVDILTKETQSGAFTMKVYVDYNEDSPVNISTVDFPIDPFFNETIPTYKISGIAGSKNIQRVYCNARGSFITIQYTFSDVQMMGQEQEEDIEIDMQILYMRKAGSQLTNIE